jgi:DNA-binding winged helix-turn-helix (wHTH) protein
MMAEDNFVIGEIIVSPQHNSLSRGQLSCRLQPKVMAVLVYLHSNHERVVSQDELLDHVWEGRIVSPGSIQKSVNALRSAFTELDKDKEYVVYFSKRGYQLVTPENNVYISPKISKHAWYRQWHYTFWLSMVLIIGVVIFQVVELSAPKNVLEPSPERHYATQFNQVKPYVSNTGRDSLVEPFSNSERVAYIRNSEDTQKNTISQLIIQSASGPEWIVSSARGKFVELAWSASGRNLVAIDLYSSKPNESSDPLVYCTLHIYTLDFKGEKVIEKNLLSYWQGTIDSITWWDETTLEFVAAQTFEPLAARYQYRIIDQNLSKLESKQGDGLILATQVFNNKVAELIQLNSGWQINLFDAQQKLVAKHLLPLQVNSMSWLNNGSAVLLLTEDNQLSILTEEGNLHTIDYSPRINGNITRARFSDADQSLILTVVNSTPNKTAEINAVPEYLLFNSGAVKYTENR